MPELVRCLIPGRLRRAAEDAAAVYPQLQADLDTFGQAIQDAASLDGPGA